MAELLLELLSEEIPARMQARAAEDLRRLVTERLTAAGLAFSEALSFVTPRRLTLVVQGLPVVQPDVAEERRGPRVGSPDKAVEGFLASAGVTLAECEERDTGKGVFYFAIIRKEGGATADMLPALLEAAALELPWPKSMRWGSSDFRWVRPLHGVLCLFDGAVLPMRLGPAIASDHTVGHRFLAPSAFVVKNFADYRAKLREAFVQLDPKDRCATIRSGAHSVALSQGLAVKADPGLLDEVVGLVEWPVVLLGDIDERFMDVPPEVLTTAMRAHQKYFSLLTRDGELAAHFVVVANMLAEDQGRAIVAGNERVLRARLSDAKFFWDQDRRHTLDSRVPKLAERVFYKGLGTVKDKAKRLVALIDALEPHIRHLDREAAKRAARLAKADLSTGMVGEFPELQGIMGRYYALHDGERADVARAIAEHYSPLGPADTCPTLPISVAVSLADKIDSLAGFFSIGEKPTGSKDPFALRRAALGVIRLIIENKLRLPLDMVFSAALAQFPPTELGAVRQEILDFFADRLKVHLREQGVRHDLVSAVFALGGEDDLVRLLARVDALKDFLATEDGTNLLVAFRRAGNIVRIEERKDRANYDGAPDPAHLAQEEEIALHHRLCEVRDRSAQELNSENFNAAMALLATLRHPVDAFFDSVTVNCDDRDLRANRLRLLSQIRATLGAVADFTRIEG